MLLYLYEPQNLTLKGVCENVISLKWRRKYFTYGDFEIVIPSTDKHLQIFTQNMILGREDGEAGIITSVTLKCDDKGEIITASGRLLTGLLKNRILLGFDSDFTGVIDKNIGQTAAANRRIPNLYVDRSVRVTSDCHEAFQYQNLADYAQAVCTQKGIGLKTVVEQTQNRRLLMSIVKGVDRSIEQSINPRVVFSADFDNLLGVKYQYSSEGTVSTVYGRTKEINNDNTITPPRIYTHGNGKTGFDRFEKSIEVKAITEEYELEVVAREYGEGREYSYLTAQRINPDPTLLALAEKTSAAIKEPCECFVGDVIFERGYKVKYDIGDVVTIFHSKWGLTRTLRICEVLEHYQKGGVKITPVFGTV